MATYYTLPTSGLRMLSSTGAPGGDAYGIVDWATHFDYNIIRINNILLKLKALLDVNPAGWVNNATPRWNVGTSKWDPWVPDRPLTTGTDV